MAKRIPNSCDNTKQMEHQKFRIDPDTGEIVIAVTDEDAQQTLADILSALNGTSDTVTTVTNIDIVAQNVEQAIQLPPNTKRFLIRSRDKGILRLAYAVGGTSSDYLTLVQGVVYEDANFYQSQSVYVMSSKPGDVIELVTHV